MMVPLRAVVADDSALYRAVLMRALSALGGVEVVGQATNGAEAVSLVRKHTPDLLTLDLNMPVLDGLGALRLLRNEKLQCEVLVVSAETRQGAATTLEALHLGAVDFVTKPAEDDAQISMELLTNELRRQLAAIRLRRAQHQSRSEGRGGSIALAAAKPVQPTGSLASRGTFPVPQVVVVGTSTGGPAALPILLSVFPSSFPLPILIVQHMPPLFTASLAESLDRKCALHVVEAHNGQALVAGHVYIAPGGRHLKVKRAFDKSVRLTVTDEPPENHCRPSVDVLFRSVAQEYAGNVIAAILTGMGNDGVAGLRQLKAHGAQVVAQNESTCTVFGMPQEAIRAAVVDQVLPLDRIAPAIIDSIRPNGK